MDLSNAKLYLLHVDDIYTVKDSQSTTFKYNRSSLCPWDGIRRLAAGLHTSENFSIPKIEKKTNAAEFIGGARYFSAAEESCYGPVLWEVCSYRGSGRHAGWWLDAATGRRNSSFIPAQQLLLPGPWSHRPQHCCYIPRRRLAGHLSVGISGFSDSFWGLNWTICSLIENHDWYHPT